MLDMGGREGGIEGGEKKPISSYVHQQSSHHTQHFSTGPVVCHNLSHANTNFRSDGNMELIGSISLLQ